MDLFKLTTTALNHLSVQGYIEGRALYQPVSGVPWTAVERIRPTARLELNNRIRFTATTNIHFTQGRFLQGEFLNLIRNPIESSLLPDLNGNTPSLEDVMEDCAWTLDFERNETWNDRFSLPRLYLDLNRTEFDVRIGRQAINWGSSLFFNPTDVLAENLIDQPWQERKGADAFKINRSLGETGLMTTILAKTDENLWLAAIKAGALLKETNVYGILSASENKFMGGLDIKGDREFGWWLESSYSFLRSNPEGAQDHIVQMSLGVDYSFPILNLLLTSFQISFDSSGESPDYYNWTARHPREIILPPCPEYNIYPPEAQPYRQTLGRWYGISYLNIQMAEHITINNAALLNLADGTGFVFPSLNYSGDSLSLNFGAQLLLGAEGEFSPSNQSHSFGVNMSELTPSWSALGWLRWNY